MRSDSVTSAAGRPLRLWPGVAAVALEWVLWAVLPLVAPEWSLYGILGGVACGVIVILWWLLFSRAPIAERIGALLLMVAAVAVVRQFVDRSISNGMQGMMQPFYSLPVVTLGLVAGAAATRHAAARVRRPVVAAAILLGAASLLLIRTGGISGEGVSDLHWRWTPTPEERLLATVKDEPLVSPAPAAAVPSAPPAPVSADVPGTNASPGAPAAAADTGVPSARAGEAAAPATAKPAGAAPAAFRARGAEWPGFRGPERDSVVRGVRIATDWAATPPVELWRRPIGPGWSSFAVQGDLIYTQEQRGDDEVVSAYRLSTGEPVWRHRDSIRFYESNGGPGPRATPTIDNGRVFTMGATGLLNALDAAAGTVLWSRNAASDTGKTVPDWGIASSPIVVGDLVIVAVAGQLAAYDSASGQPRWKGQPGGTGYSSPHLATIDGVPQVLLLRGSRTISVNPADGTLLWEHTGGPPSTSIVQPALTDNGDVLVASGDAMGGLGLRRVALTRSEGGWKTEERWNSSGLKPYFNDLVVDKGYAFGFDGSILACIDLNDGTRKWKGGRYGHGQMLLLADQDLLLVTSEDGEIALVSATPDKFTEIAKVPAIDGKTWNHPVVVGHTLLVRNGEQMVAFRLPAPAADGTR